MNQEDLDYFRLSLNNKLQELLSHACNTVSDMTEHGDKFPDPSDRATLEAYRNFKLRICDREYKLIWKIKEAIKRIDEGLFGVCDKCGGDISIARLNVRPVTTQCIKCKIKEEAFEKYLGI